jgi:ABC-type nitrate/sulfonate/bicarbonate transport system substrate-binding protein
MAVPSSAAVFPEPHPSPPSVLRVIGFQGGFNLPIWIAQRQGFLAAEGLAVELSFTPGSTYQITQLLAGRYDVAMTAFDNVVAYREGQNEAYVPPQVEVDLVTVLASDDAFLSIVAQPGIAGLADLRGRTVTVDAMTTGFAFVLREMLARAGVPESEVTFERAGGVASRFRAMLENPRHAATTQMTPFELLGESRGLTTLVRVRDELGPYLGMTAAVRRSWADANRPAVVGFVRAYQKALDWLHAPENRPVVEAILVANVPGMTPALAARAYTIYAGPAGGFVGRAVVDADAAATVLTLRERYGRPERKLADPLRYVDTSFLAEAGVR